MSKAHTFLIVDDSSTTRSILKKMLALARVELGELVEANNGQEGLAILRGRKVDLVLTDLNMPVMSGADMINQMTLEPAIASVPVVVISSEGNQTVLDSLAKKGVYRFIRKPIHGGLFREVIEEALQTRL